MKKFNKHDALNRLSNKNNSKIKKRTIIISVIVLVGAILYFSFARFESIVSFNLISGTANIQNISLIDKINELKTNGSTELEYDGIETLGENGTLDNNLRYVGATPNNYIYFNCSTNYPNEMNDSTCEIWRIIGLFNNVEDNHGYLRSFVKIMKNEPLGLYSWDSSELDDSESHINAGYGINQWGPSTYIDGTSYEGADLMRELNTDYLGNITVGTDGKWYNFHSNSKQADAPTLTLNSDSQDMIQDVTWNTGANESEDSSLFIAKNIYIYERSQNIGRVCSSGTFCNDSVNRTTSWIGKVALMYPSDYLYATSGGITLNKNVCLNTVVMQWYDNSNIDGISDCYQNTWIYNNNYKQATLSPATGGESASVVFYVTEMGQVSGTFAAQYFGVRPTVFLKTSITVEGGDGSLQNPYKLGKPVK